MAGLVHKVGSLLLMVLLLGGSGGCTKEMRKARARARADKDFAAERYGRAEMGYLQTLRFPPADPHALTQLGILYQEEGRWANALTCLNEALKIEPANSEARVNLGRAYLACQWFKPAHEQAVAVLAQNPDEVEGLLLLAGSITSSAELTAAEQAFGSASTVAQGKPGYHLAHGALYLHERELAKAEMEYRQALALDPHYSQAFLALGKLFLMRQEFQQAGPMLKSAAAFAPLRSGARLTYADYQIQTGSTNEALSEVQDLVKKAPDFLPAWLFLARASIAQGKIEESKGCLQRVLGMDPVNLHGLMLKGSLLLAEGDGTNAAIQFERAVKTYPGSALGFYNLGLACLLNKDIPSAAASLDRALSLQTNYIDAILLRARLDISQGNGTAAIVLLTRLVEQQPFVGQGYSELANAYVGQKDWEQAAGVYRRMQQVFTNSAEVPFNLGAVLMGQNKTNEARSAFEESLALAPGFVPAIEQLVALDLQQNRVTEAAARVSRLLNKYPDSAALQVILAQVHLREAADIVTAANRTNSGPQLRPEGVPAAQERLQLSETELLKALELSSDYPPAERTLASLYFNSGRQEKALSCLNSLLARTNDAVCLMQKALIQEQLKDYSGARDSYEKILKEQPDAYEALNNLAFLWGEHFGQVERGCELAEKAHQLRPGDPAVEDTLGWLLYRRGDYSRALPLLKESAEKLSAAEIQFHFGMANYFLGNEEQAATTLKRALAEPKSSESTSEARECLAILSVNVNSADADTVGKLQKRVAEAPKDVVALQRLAAIQERNGNIDGAIASYEAALKLCPGRTQVMLRLARLYGERPDTTQKALELAREAHSLEPGDAQISHFLGYLLFRAGSDFKWANTLLEDSARKLPDDPAVLYDVAWSRFSIGELPESLDAMQAAVQKGLSSSRAAAAKQFVAFVSASTNSSAVAATAEARVVLVTNETYVPAMLLAAREQEEQGQFADAALTYDAMLRRYPLFAPAVRAQALLQFDRLGDQRKAYAFAVKAREAFPADPEVARVLGILVYRRGDYGRAAQLLGEAGSQRAKNAECLYYLGLAQYQLKAPAQSREALQRALALNLPATLAADANRILKELK